MTGPERVGRRRWVDIVLLLAAGSLFLTLLSLGNWQLRRLDWKLALIEAVETRAFAEPAPPPSGPITAEDHAYLRLRVTGDWRHPLSRKVKAVTELGPGHWLLTPLRTAEGHVWVNRGFVPSGVPSTEWTAPDGVRQVEGLLRITEPGGTLLEDNKPAEGRWVSRDVAALSADAGLQDAAAFFIDADHVGAPTAWPRGGLTVLSFRNNHLAYALTWYAMAALFLAAMIYAVRDRLRDRLPNQPTSPT